MGKGRFCPVIEARLRKKASRRKRKNNHGRLRHNAVLGVADKVVEAVKQGAIRHFFLIGGCDGAKSGKVSH